MLRIFSSLFLLGLYLHTCEALSCMVCSGQTSDECQSNQRSELCPKDQTVCRNFFDFSNGRTTVQKGCFQASACTKQATQKDNDCESQKKNAPCRCCCKTTNCNENRKGCIVPGKCGRPKPKKPGTYTCPDKKQLQPGDVCIFSCPTDMELVGPPRTKCVRPVNKKPTWKPTNQMCKKIRCDPLSPPGNGTMNCANKGKHEGKPDYIYLKTQCKFACNEGFRLKGALQSVCQFNEKWSNPVPTCVPDQCDPNTPPDKNRVHKCTNGNFVKSVCTYECKKGWKLVGSKEAECKKVGDKKKWDNKAPRCLEIKCFPEHLSLRNGGVSCTNSNLEGSVCTFDCNSGYDLTGTTALQKKITCNDDGDDDAEGEWSDKAPKCLPIKCHPELKSPDNGDMTCDNGNLVDSECTFTCEAGYDLVGTRQPKLISVCEDDGDGDVEGEWSKYPEPTCEPVKCDPPFVNPVNGKVGCTNSVFVGSSCTFTCNRGYDLVEEDNNNFYYSNCRDDQDGDAEGEWTRPAPTCSRITCEVIVAPEHGSSTCTDDNNYNSKCEIECDYGYKSSRGKDITTLKCEDDNNKYDNKGEWSDKVPTCSRIVCGEQEHGDTVVKSCDPESTDGKYPVDTICTYTCAITPGHFLVSHESQNTIQESGSLDVVCLDTPRWSRRAPRCNPVKCRDLKTPKNGFSPDCGDTGYWLDSVCSFKCEPTYALTHTESLTCESAGTDHLGKGKWDREEPRCEKNECGPYRQVANGMITYTDRFRIGSWANLTCNGGYTYKEHEAAQCQDKDKGNPDWSEYENVCCVPCLRNDHFKIVVILDKNAAQNEEDLKEIATWQFYFLDDLWSKDYEIKYSLVYYEDGIDEGNSIDERKFRSDDDAFEISGLVRRFPLGGGSGSDTGAALQYAKDKYLSRYTATTTSRRPSDEPFIIIIKGLGPVSSDIVDVAKSISDERIHIMALGFKRRDFRAEMKHLTELTGDRDRVVMSAGSGDMPRASEIVTKISEEQGCSASSRNVGCPKDPKKKV